MEENRPNHIVLNHDKDEIFGLAAGNMYYIITIMSIYEYFTCIYEYFTCIYVYFTCILRVFVSIYVYLRVFYEYFYSKWGVKTIKIAHPIWVK